MRRLSPEEIRISIVGRLRSRRNEIEDTIIARIRDSAFDSPGNMDIQYEEGQRVAITAVLDYALRGIADGEEWTRPIPLEVVEQAQRAARNGVELSTILRRYHAGSTELTDFVTQEAYSGGLLGYGETFRSMQRTQALLLDHLIVTIKDEYAREVGRIDNSLERRHVERVRRLLAGGLVTSTELYYELDAWHLGIIGTGLGVGQAIRSLASGVDCQLLCVSDEEQCVWAWLGGPRTTVVGDMERLISAGWPASVSLATGEPREGVAGWRQTHHEAQAALLVARRKRQRFTRCSHVVLEAAMLRDNTMSKALRDTYLLPLDDLRVNGKVARETLRAYFAANHNVKIAAERLKVDRRTVWYRLDKITKRLGWSPTVRRAEFEVALRIEALEDLTNAVDIVSPD